MDSRLAITREHLTGLRPDPIAAQAAATEQAMRDETNRSLAEPMIAAWRVMSEKERAEAVARAEAERERRTREARAARERHHAEAHARFSAVFDRVTERVLREVLLEHCPYHEDPDCCDGCPSFYDREWGNEEQAVWPCDTFLLIERETAQ